MKVCDNVYLTQLFFQLFSYASTYPAPPFRCVFHFWWANHHQQESSHSALPLPHSTHTVAVALQSYVLPHTFPFKCSLSFKLGQERYALLEQQGTQAFLRKKDIHLQYMPSRATVHKKTRSTLKVPGISSSLYHYCHSYMK